MNENKSLEHRQVINLLRTFCMVFLLESVSSILTFLTFLFIGYTRINDEELLNTILMILIVFVAWHVPVGYGVSKLSKKWLW